MSPSYVPPIVIGVLTAAQTLPWWLRLRRAQAERCELEAQVHLLLLPLKAIGEALANGKSTPEGVVITWRDVVAIMHSCRPDVKEASP